MSGGHIGESASRRQGLGRGDQGADALDAGVGRLDRLNRLGHLVFTGGQVAGALLVGHRREVGHRVVQGAVDLFAGGQAFLGESPSGCWCSEG